MMATTMDRNLIEIYTYTNEQSNHISSILTNLCIPHYIEETYIITNNIPNVVEQYMTEHDIRRAMPPTYMYDIYKYRFLPSFMENNINCTTL